MAIVLDVITEFNGKGVKKAIAEFQSLEGAGKKAQFALKKAAVPATAALAGLAAVGFDAAKAAMEDDAAQQKLARQLQVSAHATDAVVKSTEDWIAAQGVALGITDEEIRPALAGLVRVTKDVKKSQDLMAIAFDVAAATGKPLETVTKALEKAYGGNVKALTKLDPSLKGFIDKTTTADQAVSKMAGKFQGAASTSANTMQGQFQRLKVSLDETKESIGAALLPVVQKIIPYLNKMGAWASKHTGVFLTIAGVIGALAVTVMAVNAAMKVQAAITALVAGTKAAYALVTGQQTAALVAETAATTAATTAQTGLNTALSLNPIGLIVIAIAALIAGLVIAYKKFDGFRNVVNAIGRALKTGFLAYLGVIKTELNLLWGVIKFVFNGIADLWNNTIGRVKIHIPDIKGLPGRGKTFGVPNIPKLADGGVVNSPTLALIGEAGPEAVVPLGRGGGIGGNTFVIQTGVGDPTAIGREIERIMQKYDRRSRAA